jgi:transposase InsO family protein
VDGEIKRRRRWVELLGETGDSGLVCRRCGISRPTLRKWARRFEAMGESGLASLSRRPRSSPKARVGDQERELILKLRKDRRLGARRIQREMARHHEIRLALATIHKVLTRAAVRPLKRWRRKTHGKRYSRPIPGERVQMDTCKILPGIYQYTAVDDWARYRVLAVFRRRTAANTIEFLEQVLEEMYFPVQRVQTDRGREFFALEVQQWLMDRCIKFRPLPPRSPHLNGKVERSQKTDLDEFWSAADVRDPDLGLRLAEWQHYYNWERPHSSLNGRTPMDRYYELTKTTPLWEDLEKEFDRGKERFREADFRLDQRLAGLKRCP